MQRVETKPVPVLERTFGKRQQGTGTVFIHIFYGVVNSPLGSESTGRGIAAPARAARAA
jgi:hypothetical protein